MKRLVLSLLVLAMLVAVPVEARNVVGIGFDSITFYPMGLYGIKNGFAVGAEVYPGLSYLGIIGRYYQHSDFSGPYAGLVLGSMASDKAAPYGLSVLRLQGGYGLRLEENGRIGLSFTHDTVGAAGLSSTGVIAELQYVF